MKTKTQENQQGQGWVKRQRSSSESRQFLQFETPGESVEGEVMAVREISTKFGMRDVVDLSGGESFIISAGMDLSGDDIGRIVKVTFTGWQKNTKSGRMYKEFEVFVLDESLDGEAPF